MIAEDKIMDVAIDADKRITKINRNGDLWRFSRDLTPSPITKRRFRTVAEEC